MRSEVDDACASDEDADEEESDDDYQCAGDRPQCNFTSGLDCSRHGGLSSNTRFPISILPGVPSMPLGLCMLGVALDGDACLATLTEQATSSLEGTRGSSIRSSALMVSAS